VHGQAVTTTHAVASVPANWRGRRVIFAAVTANIWINFGTANTVEVDRTAVSTNAGTPTFALTAVATAGTPIHAGTAIDFIIDPDSTFFAFEGDASGYLYMWLADVASPNS